MFEKLGRDARRTVRRARELAQTQGSTEVEVEHLLLAIIEHPTGRAAEAIASVGLTAAAVEHAMDRELVGALASAGVVASARSGFAFPIEHRVPRWGQSAKLALKRALAETLRTRSRTIRNDHLLLAIIAAEAGRMPRLLDELEIDPDHVRRVIDD